MKLQPFNEGLRGKLRVGGSAVLNSIMGTYYSRLRNAAIAAARRNNASLRFAGEPADLAGFVFQDSTGTTPATGTDPIGLLLDRQYGAANLGQELAGSLNTWTPGAGWAIAGSTLVASAAGAFSSSSVAAVLVAGRTYRVEYTVSAYSAGSVRLRFLTGTATTAIDRTSAGTFSEFIVANPSNATIAVQTGASGFTGTVSAVSVREVLGIPALQATAANKPTLELQANGYYGMRFDGTNDFLSNTLPLSNVANHTLIVSGRVNSVSADRTLSTGGAPTTATAQRVAQIRVSQTGGLAQTVYVTDAVVVSQINGAVNLLNTSFVGAVVAASATATLYVNGSSVGTTAINAGVTTTSIGVTGGNKNTGAFEPMSGLIFLECRCASAMPDADRFAVERFAALLSGAAYA